jgi:hypothetical protein
MDDNTKVDIVTEEVISPDGEILELVEILIEYREGRYPRHGRVYRVLIDDVVVDFHHDNSRADEMLRLVGKDVAEGWVLYEVVHGKDVRLDPEQTVHFRRHGLERFHTRQDLVTIEVNQEPKRVRPGCWVVAALKAAVGVPPAKVLAEIKPDGTFDNLSDDARIDIKGGEKFISHARRGGSS